jgi:predicted transcriptional regulator
MGPESSVDRLAIPPALLAEVKAAAAQERRPVADVLRDLVELGLAERREWMAHAEKGRQRSIDLGIHDPEDDEPMTDEYRQDIREKIAQGLKSLREGRYIDGETFMAKMDAELAELERQGR